MNDGVEASAADGRCRFGEGLRHDWFMNEAMFVNVSCGLPAMFGLDQHANCP